MWEYLLQAPPSVLLLGAFVVLLMGHTFSTRFKWQEKRKEPPGPRGLPLLGNLLQMDLKRPHKTLLELSKKYGSVFTVYWGHKKVVVLAGYKTVKEALVNQAHVFGERDITPIFKDFNKGHGMLFSNGSSWREMRRFALSTLRDFGMGKRSGEEKIIDECRYLIEEFEQHKGKAFNNSQALNYATCNAISIIVFGKRFEYTDPLFQARIDRINKTFRLCGSPYIQLYNLYPWLGHWLKDWWALMDNLEENKRETRRLTQELKETLNPEMSRSYIDSFLIQMESVKVSGNTDSYFHEENMVCSIINLFGAGTDTTAHTLQWGLLLMAKYPHIQDKVQEELSRVTGSRQVQLNDRKNLPYTDAVIHETQRFASILPLALPHKTSCDVTFQGYFIEKGTALCPLLFSVLYDENEWKSPNTFNPSNFLDNEGKFIKGDAFMPFSAGSRMCVGESLARMEIFLFFASLLQHFRFTPPPGVTEDELDLSPGLGFTIGPLPHSLCAASRH